jgi:uncharacterized protein YjbI with pentapeptide repeats
MIHIINYATGEIIYSSRRSNRREAVKDLIDRNECLDYADLTGIDLSNLNLSKVSFQHCILDGVNFRGSNLHHTNFTGARMFNTIFCENSIHQADFSNVYGSSTFFINVSCNAKFNQSNLQNAVFTTQQRESPRL